MDNYILLLLVCDLVENQNTNCHGSCTRFLVDKTSTVEECMDLCKKKDMCRHYIWHKQGNKWEQECWVVMVEKEGEEVDVYRNSDSNTITGTCKRGNTMCMYEA